MSALTRRGGRLLSCMAYPSAPSAPGELLSRLPAAFERARSSGELFYFPSSSHDIDSFGRRFNLRCCPALQNKEKAKAELLAAVREDASQEAVEGDRNKEPFRPPYVEELYVGSLAGKDGDEGLSMLLNKYAVLPEHLLLCPTSFERQDLPPRPDQIALAYDVIVAASRHPERPRKLMAFYNGGKGAGASQAWRHIQLIEVPGGQAPVEEWVRDIKFDRQDLAMIHPTLPYLHIAYPIPPGTRDFAPAIMSVLDVCFDAVRRGGGSREGGWNLLLTLDHIHLIPRSKPQYPMPAPAAPLEVNSLGYAGMLLVKSEDEEKVLLDAVQGCGLVKVLETCGVPRAWGEEALEARALYLGHSDMA